MQDRPSFGPVVGRVLDGRSIIPYLRHARKNSLEIIMVGKGLIGSGLAAVLLIAVMNVPNAVGQERHRGTTSWGMTQGVAPVFVIRYGAVQKELGLKPEQFPR